MEPYKVQVPQAALDDLKARIKNTRWPEKEPVSDWSQGTPLGWLQNICEYWGSSYDWRRIETKLNEYEGYTLSLDPPGESAPNPCDIHFLHIRSKHEDATPLVMTHGWPGSVLEFHKVIGPLTDPTAHGGEAQDAFHLVLPTLPGFGFSGKPTKTGWGIERIADAWAQLMPKLGYERFAAQGGDWGSIITIALALQHPERLIGIHLNMPIVAPELEPRSELSDLEKRALAASRHYQQWDSGYSTQQRTRPQTVGYGLVDSPIGQAAWILEKFWAWTDCDGDPLNILSKDELLDNVTLYWLTASGASSARIYWESFGGASGAPEAIPEVPVGCSIFPKEIFQTSERWAKKRFKKLVHFGVLDKGGHFAAFEQPALFVSEVRKTFRAI